MLQTALFPSPIGMSLEKAEEEYNSLTAKGAKVHLVLLKNYSLYTTCFFSKKLIEGKLKSEYKLIK